MTVPRPGESEPQGQTTTGASAAPGAGGPTGSADPTSPAEPDWTDQVTDLVVDTVDKVRSRTTGPVLNVAHATSYAIVATVLAIPILIAFFAGLVKGLNWLIPGGVWIVYTIIAVMLWVIGAILWAQRDRAESSTA